MLLHGEAEKSSDFNPMEAIMEEGKFSIRKKVYYHDTDAGGVVYYGRYLEFLEDARTEFFLSRNIQMEILAKEGTLFVIAHIDVDYRKPALYGDEVTVSAGIEKVTASSIHFRQDVTRGDDLLIEARIVVVCIGSNFRPKRLPDGFHS